MNERLAFPDYPLCFRPELKEKVWGGRSLERLVGAAPTERRIGEAWLIHESMPVQNGPLRGRNARGLKVGDRAILFVRPESFKLGAGAADVTLAAETLSSAFEGNATHVFLKGATKKDITITVGRHGGNRIPNQGEQAQVHYEPDMGIVLPEGKMARE